MHAFNRAATVLSTSRITVCDKAGVNADTGLLRRAAAVAETHSWTTSDIVLEKPRKSHSSGSYLSADFSVDGVLARG